MTRRRSWSRNPDCSGERLVRPHTFERGTHANAIREL
jgi:hypothetical protein